MTDRRLTRDWSAPIRYPDPAIEHLDRRFGKYRVGSATLERLWTGGRWNEGPVWIGDQHCLIWSDIPNDRMLRWSEERAGRAKSDSRISGIAAQQWTEVQRSRDEKT